MHPPPPATSERLHALDAVRAIALLLGIWLHASLSFLPGGYFIIEDDTPSPTLQVIFFIIHVFRMSAFFMIAGFFGRMMLHRRGTAAFINDRARRIVLPFVVGWIVCTALIQVVFAWGFQKRYGITTTASEQGWSWVWLTHLWFLYYLILIYALTLLVRSVWVQIDRNGTARQWIDRGLRFIVTYNLAAFVVAAPVAWILYSINSWYAWGGIPTPDHWLVPQRPTLAFAIAFAFGWLLQRQPDLLRFWEQRWLRNLVAAIAFMALAHYLVGRFDEVVVRGGGWNKAVYAVSYALATWTTTIALVGLGMRFLSDESPWRRYLADASYWLYIAHVPPVFALQTAVMGLTLHWSLKFAIVMGGTCALLLPMYHFWVRPTFIGEALNGRRYPRPSLSSLWQRATPQPPLPVPDNADRAL